ncbi:PH domain-containing protein [Streptomyces sp. NPDC058877]|uniref:PH domain-containing protein n=1 Tax=unclassified Streptomyces TaxID=2593676 RepID=UPI0036C85877
MEYGPVTGGRVLRRRSFRVLALLVLALFGGGSALALHDALLRDDPDGWIAAALLLVSGSCCYRVMRSRVHLGENSLTVVNPLFSYEVPYGAIRKIEVGSSGSLTVLPKETVADAEDDGYLAVGFAGSLLDRVFKSSDEAAVELKKHHKRRRRAPGANGPVRRRLVADAVAEAMLLSAAVCAACAVALRQ